MYIWENKKNKKEKVFSFPWPLNKGLCKAEACYSSSLFRKMSSNEIFCLLSCVLYHFSTLYHEDYYQMPAPSYWISQSTSQMMLIVYHLPISIAGNWLSHSEEALPVLGMSNRQSKDSLLPRIAMDVEQQKNTNLLKLMWVGAFFFCHFSFCNLNVHFWSMNLRW